MYLDLKDKNFEKRLLHLGLIYIDSSVQGKSLSYLLSVFPNILIVIKNGFRDIWISSVSQVPAVVGLVATNYYNVYPNVDGTKQSFIHKQYSDLIMRDYRESFGVGKDAEWNSKQQIIMNAYSGGSDNLKKKFDESPKHRKETFNKLCEDQLDYDRGDDFLQIGTLSPSIILELFKVKVGSKNKLLLFFVMSIVATFSIFMPLIRWISKKKVKNDMDHSKRVL